MAITFHGVASVPTDNGTSALTQTTITPPASMLSGDLVVVYCRQRGSATWSVGLTGGQTWTSYDTPNSTNISVATFYCKFNGTWDVNPRFDSSAGTHTSVQMLVFRPSSGYRFVLPHYVQATNEISSATVTITALDHTQASNLSIAAWHTADDNTWGNLSGTGWVKTGLSAQYRNLAGNDGSCTYAYRIGTATGTTGTVSQQQLTLGTDLTRWSHIGFYEELIQDPPEVPTLISPNDAATNVGLTPTFSFSTTDPQSDPIRYNIQIYQGVASPLIDLQDDFNDIAIDLAKWQPDFLNGSVQETGGRVRLSVIANSADAYAQIYSASSGTSTYYDFTGKGCVVEAYPDLAGDAFDTYIELYLDANNRIWFIHRNGQLFAQTKIAGVNSSPLGTVTYNATNMRWWRIRENSGTLYWDYSPDDVNWTNMYNTANPFAVTSLNVVLVIYQGNPDDIARVSEFDNFNVASGVIHEDAVSGTDPGFSGTPDNTDPFTSGQTVSYTVQTPLSYNTTYSWRVRASDPTGTNTFHHWSSIRTFTTEAAPAGNTYDDSVSLSASITDSYALQLIFNESLSLITNKLLESTSIGTFNDSTVLSSDNLMTALSNSLIDVSTSLVADLQEDVTGSLSIFEIISLITDKNVSSTNVNILQEIISLLSTQQVSSVNVNILQELVSLMSNQDIASSSQNVINDSVSLASIQQITSSGGIELSDSITLSTANQVVSLNTLDLNLSTILTSNITDSYLSSSIIETNVSISSNNDIQSLSINIINDSVTLSSTNQVTSLAGQILEAVLTLSSSHQVTSSLSLVINEIVTLLSDNNISAVSQHVLQETLVLSTSNQVVSINNIVADNTVSLDTSNILNSSGSSTIDLALTLSTNKDLVSIVANTLNEVLSLAINSDFVTNDTAFFFYEESVILSLGAEVSSTASAVLQATALITSTNDVNASSIATLLESVALNTDISQAGGKVINLDGTVSLETSQGIITAVAKSMFEAIAIAVEVQQNYSSLQTFQQATNIALDSTLTTLVNQILQSNVLLSSDLTLVASVEDISNNIVSLNSNATLQVLGSLITNEGVVITLGSAINSIENVALTYNELITLVLDAELYVDGVKDGILILRFKSNSGPLTIKFKPKE